MKKILAFTMVLSMLFTLCSFSTSASTDVVYSVIRYDASAGDTCEFSYWVQQMGYLENVKDYTAEYGEELVALYKDYVNEQRSKVLAAGEKFFETYFDKETDVLVRNSDRRGQLVVKSSVSALQALPDDPEVWVTGTYESEEWAVSHYDNNNSNVLVPHDGYIENITPYQLVFALEYYKDNTSERTWSNRYTTFSGYLFESLYYHTVDATSDEATTDEVDYIFTFACGNGVSPAYCAAGFGDKYLVQVYNIYSPYGLGYHIITTADNKVYSLREAWDLGLEGIDDIFTDYGLGEIRGDSDGDKVITVKDATYVQKCLAGVMKFTDREYVGGINETNTGSFSDYVSDMNMDGKVNVRDATAIQKYVAGIDY